MLLQPTDLPLRSRAAAEHDVRRRFAPPNGVGDERGKREIRHQGRPGNIQQSEVGLMPNLALPSFDSVPARNAAELAMEPPMRRGIEPRRMGTAHRQLRWVT
ncbi:hypothetical protein NB231_12459 [Nitrococcus mobilis Nb-231]|uniref:Uncharacterized protein n=1 Tax=Nitrococcus mobilis Nb-231 TaxID=314278 RepID=A4BPP9_9GAMM|nr:hypothetical protein NB231_12459 [Nitrococcus mobilis Nb-231]